MDKHKFNFKDVKCNSKFLWFIFNILRWVPQILFSILPFIFNAIYAGLARKTYKEHKAKWDEAQKSYDNLINFMLNDYHYHGDPLAGFFDHDSSWCEWIMKYGDCDDAALYGKKALKKLGFEAYRIGIMGLKYRKKVVDKKTNTVTEKLTNKLSAHFDCLWVLRNENGEIADVYLLNYGKVVNGKSIDEAIDNLSLSWRNFPKGHVKICLCAF